MLVGPAVRGIGGTNESISVMNRGPDGSFITAYDVSYTAHDSTW